MHIIYIHQYFVSPRQSGGTRSYEMAQYLVEQGHRVSMIFSGLENSEYPAEPGRPYTYYEQDGIELYSLPVAYNDGRKATALPGWRRMIAFAEFARAATKVGKTLDVPDMIFATHTPLHVGFSGIALKKHFGGTPFVFEVRDLWPEALVNIGALTNPAAIRVISKMADFIYQRADHLTAASPGMKEGILAYGIPDERVTVVTNASDLKMFRPEIDGSGERERLGLGNRFSAIYFGAMGMANGLDYAIDAAIELKARGRDDIAIVLHGHGGEKDRLKQRVATAKLENVVFSDPVDTKEQVARMVAGCDACLTIYRATTEQSWSPNKMFDALAAGRPVCINVGGWLGDTISQNGAGFATDPEDPTALADALIELADDPLVTKRMGVAARELAESTFSRDSQCENLVDAFEAARAVAHPNSDDSHKDLTRIDSIAP